MYVPFAVFQILSLFWGLSFCNYICNCNLQTWAPYQVFVGKCLYQFCCLQLYSSLIFVFLLLPDGSMIMMCHSWWNEKWSIMFKCSI